MAERLAWRISEAAEALGVGRSLMYRLVQLGPPDGVRTIRLGKAVRIPDAELRRLTEATKREDAG